MAVRQEQPPGNAPGQSAPEPESLEDDDTLSEEMLRKALHDPQVPESEDSSAASDTFWWKDYVLSEECLSSCLSFFLRLLHHSRIRTLQTTGTLGLPQPHQTGMVAGFLYMLLPEAVQNLQFDFLEEVYDCHIRITGRIYPVSSHYTPFRLSFPGQSAVCSGRHVSTERNSLMDKNYIKNNLETIFENFQNMIKVETVVGQAVHIGDTILVPFVDITFGFGTGGVNGKEETGRQSGGGGGGAKMEPTAVLVIKGDRVEMFSIKKGGYQASAFEKLLTMAPEIIDKLKKDKYIYIKDEDETVDVSEPVQPDAKP